jgi:hypothetical protein
MSQIPGTTGRGHIYGENSSHNPHSDERSENQSRVADNMEMTSGFHGFSSFDEFLTTEDLAFHENLPDGVDFSGLGDNYGILQHNEEMHVPEAETATSVPENSQTSPKIVTIAQLTERSLRAFDLEDCDPEARFSTLASRIFDKGHGPPAFTSLATMGLERSNIVKTVDIITWWLRTDCYAYNKQQLNPRPESIDRANLGCLIQKDGIEWLGNAPTGVLLVTACHVLRAAVEHIHELSSTTSETARPSWSQVCGEWAKNSHSKG